MNEANLFNIFMHRVLQSFNHQSGGPPLFNITVFLFSPYLNSGNPQGDTFFQVLPTIFQVEWTKHTSLSAGFYLTDAGQVCIPRCSSIPFHESIFIFLSTEALSRTVPQPVFPLETILLCSTLHFQPLAASPCTGLSLQCICLSSQSNAACSLFQEAYSPVIQIFDKDFE